MRRILLVLTVAAMMAAMMAVGAGPAQAEVSMSNSGSSGGSTGGVSNGFTVVQVNGHAGDIGDDFFDDFGSGISFFGSGFDFDDSDGTEVSFG